MRGPTPHTRPRLSRNPLIGNEIFAASLALILILGALGDVIDIAMLGEAGLEVALFDFGAESSVTAVRYWPLLQALFATGAILAGIGASVLLICAPQAALRAAPVRGIGKIPI